MTIYIVNFNDQDNYAAYTSEKKAKEVLWDAYCEDITEETRLKWGEEDKRTLEESGYIVDYGWIAATDLFNENGDPIKEAR